MFSFLFLQAAVFFYSAYIRSFPRTAYILFFYWLEICFKVIVAHCKWGSDEKFSSCYRMTRHKMLLFFFQTRKILYQDFVKWCQSRSLKTIILPTPIFSQFWLNLTSSGNDGRPFFSLILRVEYKTKDIWNSFFFLHPWTKSTFFLDLVWSNMSAQSWRKYMIIAEMFLSTANYQLLAWKKGCNALELNLDTMRIL